MLAVLAALKSHPRATVLTTVIVAALGIGGWQAWVWWESHKPRTFTPNALREVKVTAQPPGAVSPGAPDKDLKPQPLVVRFAGAPVAPLEKIGKDAADAVVTKPQFQGKWTWRDGSTLVFQPDAHWPPDTAITVKLNPTALAKDLHLDQDSLTLKTAPLVARLKEFSFYNSPVDPAVYQVVAELEASHPFDLAVLEQRLRMEVLGGTQLFLGPQGSRPFTVTADPKSVRRFFIRSNRISVPAKEDFVKLTLPAGVVCSLVGTPLAAEVTAKTRVPDKYSGLKFTGAETRIIRTDEGEPQQFLFVSTNLDIDSAEVASRIGMWWDSRSWHDSYGKLRFDELQATATKVALTLVESEAPISKQHAFRFIEPRTNGQMFLRIGEGVKSPGGFETNTRHEKLISVPAYPKETRILGKGNVLALDGERKLVVESRAIKHLRVTLSRVPVSQFQHLVSMSRWSEFTAPNFDGSFSKDNISQRWSKIVTVPIKNEWEANQTVVDIAEAPPLTAPDQAAGGCGVFFVTAEPVRKIEKAPEPTDIYARIEAGNDDGEGWYDHGDYDDSSEPKDGWSRDDGATRAERFIMATDLGMLVKVGADESRDVYIMSLGGGLPVADVEIRALAINGSVLETSRTDATGHARLKPFTDCVADRKPVAILAAKGTDTTFLPLGERQLPTMDFSRFDIDGVIASRIKAVEAFVFTERGVYRPGDAIHAGVIVRRRDWQAVLEGLPLAITLTDSHGRQVGQQTTRLPYDGLFNCDFPLLETAALGVHQIAVDVLNKDGTHLFRLGRSAVRVEEFQPDRMKVATTLTPAPPAGWLAGKATTAEVSVQSLFGEAAPGRRVTMRVELSPADFGFPQWPGYAFYLTDKTDAEGSRAGRTIDLGESQTNEQGLATFTLPFDTVQTVSYRAAILTEAFEREGGRSVRQATTCLVSPHESVIGWKSDGNLGYIAKDAGRAVNLIAVGRDLKPLEITGLRRRLIEIRQVAVLTKLDNGNYAYVSTRKERALNEEPLALPAAETAVSLPTDKAGDFRLELVDEDKEVRCAIPFTVVGKADGGTIEREAELRLQLSKEDIMPGAEIEIQLSAPYAGAGLVTLERDRVIASQWFKTDTKDATIRLKIPDDAEGTYYINAAFVRATSAPEVFHSPLSYAAAPVRVLAPKKTLTYQLDAPKEMRPGTEAVFGITSSQPTRLVLYAVDEGIHQITSYKLPRPLDYFLRKQALEVRTQQWLDLLLPEYRFLKAAAFGGDGDAALSMHLNPFKRRQEPPVVFWSGIIEASPTRKEVKWLVPDYFNGNLRVMAVGCNASAIGTAETSALVKAPIILQPNTPLFVTPGDEFEATLTVFNHLPEPGETALQLKLETSAHLSVVGESTVTLPLKGGTEGIARFRLRANNVLGGGELRFTASGGNETVHRTTTLSVRPASHHLTSVTTGWFRTDFTVTKVKRTLYQEFRHTEATASITPLGLARGLEAYVREYPYGCSEQITSRAMTKLVASTETDFGLSPKDAATALDGAIRLLASRQRADGGFGYWYTDEGARFEFHSLYVLHFLSEAKLLGHAVPEELMKGALKYAAATARENAGNLIHAEMQSYAIYLLARNGTNPGPQLVNLRDTLNTKFKGQWEHRSLAAWLAASYKLLKQDGEADKLLDACLKARAAAKPANPQDPWAYYRTPMMEDIGVFYLQCRHFPERAKKFGIEALEPIMKPLRDQSFNTLACSYMTLALKAYSDLAKSTGVEVSIFGILSGNKTPQPLAGPSGGILRTTFGPDTTALRFERKQKGSGDIGAFFQVVEQGYDSGTPVGPERSGLEISREITPVAKDHPLRAGDPVEVVLRVRNVTGKRLASLAVVDLMPAGFEVVADGALKSGADTVAGADFTELREDRSLFFISLDANAEWMVKFRMKAVCAGAFVVPPALAEDMYDRGIHGVSTPGRISIEAAK